MTTLSQPGKVTTTTTPSPTESMLTPPPSPSNDKSPPPPVLLPPTQQAPPPDPPPAPPPSTPPPEPPVPTTPIPASPAPSQPSPQKPSPPPQPPPAMPTPKPPSSSPPPVTPTTPTTPEPPPSYSPSPVTPNTPTTPEPPPSSSPPPPPTTPASFPPPPPATSTPSPTPPTPAFPDTPTTPLPSLSPPPPASITQPPPPSAGRSPPSKSSSSNNSTILIEVIGSLAAALVIVGLLFVCLWRKRRRISGSGGYPPATTLEHHKGMATNAISLGNIPSDNNGSDSYPHAYPGDSFNVSKNTFTFEQLSQATSGFSDANLLGQGGFGYVHKGVLPNGEEVAIKQLKAGSRQGEREFHAEVEIISRVHHKHLVSLVGYCITGSQRLLVYEFLPNDTLHYHLHGQGEPVMDWPTRLRIAVGSARGLAYLHEDCYPKIIHRDIKAANILLDFRFEAKVADFGLAKFCLDVNTHVSTRVMGTFGYLAPEYASTGKLTEKSDVYSFGVVLLELITGRKPVNSTENMGESLVDWARPHFAQAVEDKNFDAIVDPRLQDDYDHDEMFRMVACAAMSVRYSARRRPRMSQIVRALEGNMPLVELMEEIKAAGRSTDGSQESLSSEYNTGQYQNYLSEFRRRAFASQAYESSEGNRIPETERK